MRRSFKWILGLVPVVAGSVGTAIYLTSENSISSLNEVNLERKNVQIETRISPLASSQKSKENLKTELLSPKKTEENVLDPKKIIVPNLPELPKRSEVNPRPNSEQKQKKPPIIIGDILPKTKKIQKKEQKSDSLTKVPDILIYLPETKTKPNEEQAKKQIQSKPQKTEKVAIASEKVNPDLKKVDSPKPQLPIKSIIVDKPKVEKEVKKIKQPPVESPILGPNEFKPEKAIVAKPPSPKTIILPQVNDEEKKREEAKKEELRKQQQVEAEKQLKIKLEQEKQAKIKRELEEAERLRKEEERKRQEAEEKRKHEEQAKKLEEQERKRQEEAGRAAENSSGSANSSLNGSGKSDEEIATQIANDIGSDPNFSNGYAYKLLEKYQFSKPEQMKLFLDKMRPPKTPQETANLITFWEQSYAKFRPDLAGDRGTRYMWRDEIIRKLKIQTQWNREDLNIISQSGGRFPGGGIGFP